MRMGFGFYSPREPSTFLMKALLLSFWAGTDVIAGLLLSSLSSGQIARHPFLAITALTVLIAGTVLSAFLAWSTAALPSGQERDHVACLLASLKCSRRQLGSVAAFSVLGLFITAAALFALMARQSNDAAEPGRADLAMGQKCAEVARLEKKLFRSDEQFVLAQCLIQYDKQYASALVAAVRD